MLPDPLHPAVVHLPVALAVLMPLIFAVAVAAWYRGWVPGRRVWVGVVLLQAILVGGAFAALRTGEAEEERVEVFVAENLIEAHEEAAERFAYSAGGVLAIALVAAFWPHERLRRLVALATAVAAVVVAVFAFQTGEAGGELVYRHGAADAYVTATPEPPRVSLHGD